MRICRQTLLAGVVFLAAATAGAQVREIEAWPGGLDQADRIMLHQLIDPDPDLPVPSIKDSLIREFTKGGRMTIEWSPSEINRLIDDPTIELKLFEVKAEYVKDDTNYRLWGFVNAPDSSATFLDLPEYVKISYYLRYYVQDAGSDAFRVSYWSEPVESRQDYSPPLLVVDSSQIVNLNDLGNQNWVIGRDLYIRFVASDLPVGKLEQAWVQEAGQSAVSFSLAEGGSLKTEINITKEYTLKAPEKTPVEISFWVSDVALWQSNKITIRLLWMSEDEGKDAIICFPNPFNPERDYSSKIKVGIPGVKKAYIFDPFGNLVRELSKDLTADFFNWDGRNGRGDLVSSGGYICVLDGKQKYYCKIAVYR